MGKTSKRKKTGRTNANRPVLVRENPNWPLFGLALIGIGLTGYLTVTAWSGQPVAGCVVGSSCDLVLNSRWSKLLGLPISFWGLIAYSGIAGVAWIKRSDHHWKWAWTICLFGVLYSAYLTSVSIFALGATCPYCLTSAALMLLALGVVAYQRPADLPKFSWGPWLAKTVGVAVVAVLVLHLHYSAISSELSGPESPDLRALAEHLAKTDAKFYGAAWCSHCIDQKGMFGGSAHRLPYIECSPNGPRSPQARVCDDRGIESYPTWIIKGRRYVGVLTVEELVRYSDFQG